MEIDIGHPRVLVPIEVLEGDALSVGVAELLSRGSVVLLGIHRIPEQTSPDQAEEQFGDKAKDSLDGIKDLLEEHGAEVNQVMVFTHDKEMTLNRVAEETNCLGLLIPNPSNETSEVLVPIRGDVALPRIVDLVASLFSDNDVEVTLLHISKETSDIEDMSLLEKARDELIERGVDDSRLKIRYDKEKPSVDSLLSEAEKFDAVIMGETDPSIHTFLFGGTADRLSEQFLRPVIVVLRRGEEDEVEDADLDE